MTSKRILIADDDPSIRQLLSLALHSQGYQVFVANNGYQLVHMAQAEKPDLLIVDLMMPQLDGYEAIRQLRNDTRTAHIPMLILTAKSASEEVVTGFESGADDYITKPFNTDELLARIKGHLRRAAQRPVYSPLTGLAGNVLIVEELKYRIKRNEPFALLYADLDNFKAFNDTYGFSRGDRMIKLLADVLIEGITTYSNGNDFVGHIGGDDFAVITTPDILQPLCRMIVEQFDERVQQLYDLEDLERGYLTSTDRNGIPRKFPITSISIGIVTNRYRNFDDPEEVSRIATEMKQFAKTKPGSVYEVDERGAQHISVDKERRGKLMPTLLLVSVDGAIQRRLLKMLQEHGYRTLAAPGLIEAHTLLAHAESQPNLVIVDARLDSVFRHLSTEMRNMAPELPLLMLVSDDGDQEHSFTHNGHMCIQQSVTDAEIIGVVQRLLSGAE